MQWWQGLLSVPDGGTPSPTLFFGANTAAPDCGGWRVELRLDIEFILSPEPLLVNIFLNNPGRYRTKNQPWPARGHTSRYRARISDPP